MLDAENRMATMPANLAMSSIPGRVSRVTDALRMTAAYDGSVRLAGIWRENTDIQQGRHTSR